MAGKHSPHISSNNSVETDSHSASLIGTAVNSVKKDVVQESMRDLWKQFFGTLDKSEKKQSAGDMSAGNDVFLRSPSTEQKAVEPRHQSEASHNSEIIPGMNYRAEIVHGAERARNQENREVTYRLQEVQVEIQRLMSSYQALEIEFRDVAMTQTTSNVGVYHINFLDFVLAALRSARIKIEDSGAWLGTMKGKQNYRSMAKSHGTSFTQSNERAVATQTG